MPRRNGADTPRKTAALLQLALEQEQHKSHHLTLALQEAISTLEEAHETHIYAPDDEHNDDCSYCAVVAKWRALTAGGGAQKPTGPRLIASCSSCGGTDVLGDAYAKWNGKAQEWEISSTFQKGAYCNTCDGETTIEMKKAQS